MAAGIRRCTAGASTLVTLWIFAALGCKGNLLGDGNQSQAKVETPAGVQAGDVKLDYTLTGLLVPRTRVKVSYSTDGFLFNDATPGPGSEDTNDLEVSPEGKRHTFIWDSAHDLGKVGRAAVILKITPEGGVSDRTDRVPVHNTRFVAATMVVNGPRRGSIICATVDMASGDLKMIQNDVIPWSYDSYDLVYDDGYFFVSHYLDHRITVLRLNEENQTLVPLPDAPAPYPEAGNKLLALAGSRFFSLNMQTGTLRMIHLDRASDPMTLQYGMSRSIPGGRALCVGSDRLYVASGTFGNCQIHIIDISDPTNLSPPQSWNIPDLHVPTSMVVVKNRLYVASAQSDSLWVFSIDQDQIGIVDISTSLTGIIDLSFDSGSLLAVEGYERIRSTPLGPEGQLLPPGTDFGRTDLWYHAARGAGNLVVTVASVKISDGVEIGAWIGDGQGKHTEASTLSVPNSIIPLRTALSD